MTVELRVRGISRQPRRLATLLAAMLAFAAVALPAQAHAGPATDEYTLDIPNAKGEKDDGADAPGPDAAALPPGVADDLRKDPDGKALATIASADELGAPKVENVSREESGDDSSTVTAAAGGIADPVVLGVGLALIALAAGFLILRRRSTGV